MLWQGKDTASLAARFGYVNVKVLLRAVPANAVNFWERTALHVAAWKGHADYVKALIQNGADVNAVMK